MALEIAFIMDSFDKLDSIDEDTSCCLITECLKRGYGVFYLQIKDLELQGKKVWGSLSKIVERKEDRFIMDRPEMMRLDRLQAIFIRKDPPFNLDYLYSTYILEYVSPPTFIINSPRGIREANEKLYVLNFPLFAPRSLVSKKPAKLKKFLWQIGGKMILKPLGDCSGRGVLCLQEDDINLNSLLEMATEQGKKFLIAQEYLPEIKEGDKRILILEGKPVGAMCRVPPPDDYRANIHRGAKFVPAEITPLDEKICQYLSNRLLRDGIYFAGVDVIGQKIVEINVTSPAGIPEINKLNKVNLEKVVIDWLEEKIGK
ncbi:glutathione synthase [Candidatus Aerophobetes bacterium]|uniref:Glutathione synthetase n=1 Tax=Aerophobetes bacterium TaxID=2030807 RepID=A0A523Y479_UNCAE|nr:MAG: glutathione synthase [Candidatus Aerophobetes bacterium]